VSSKESSNALKSTIHDGAHTAERRLDLLTLSDDEMKSVFFARLG